MARSFQSTFPVDQGVVMQSLASLEREGVKPCRKEREGRKGGEGGGGGGSGVLIQDTGWLACHMASVLLLQYKRSPPPDSTNSSTFPGNAT